MRYIGNCKHNYFFSTSNFVNMDEQENRNFWFLMLFRFNIIFFQPEIRRGENIWLKINVKIEKIYKNDWGKVKKINRTLNKKH